jgi:hypothetical protein
MTGQLFMHGPCQLSWRLMTQLAQLRAVGALGCPQPIVERRGEGLVRYEELFRSGSCDRALRAPGRLTLTYGHSDAFGDRLGVATTPGGS